MSQALSFITVSSMMKRAESFIGKKDNLLETIERAKKLIDDTMDIQKDYMILKEEREALQREKEDMNKDLMLRELKINKEKYHLAVIKKTRD